MRFRSRPHFSVIPMEIAAVLFGLSACESQQAVSEAEVAELYDMAAAAAAEQLPNDVCVEAELEPSHMFLNAAPHQPDHDGWRISAFDKSVSFRVIAAPNIERLPQSALEKIGLARFKKGCSERIVFAKLDVVEYRKPTASYIEATIDINRYCVLCSSGHMARFRKERGKWKIEPKLVGTFVS